ncbi:MAG TPA: hypothetical protein VGM27_32410 [Acidobacteriaceae bacterium]
MAKRKFCCDTMDLLGHIAASLVLPQLPDAVLLQIAGLRHRDQARRIHEEASFGNPASRQALGLARVQDEEVPQDRRLAHAELGGGARAPPYMPLSPRGSMV